MAFKDPGTLFLNSNKLDDFEDIRKYVSFLHFHAGTQQSQIPVNPDAILSAFGLKKVGRDLSGAKGMFQPEFGIVFIDPSDSKYRQRFGAAHELMEALFAPLKKPDLANIAKYGNYLKSTKETLCNRGAAELLMPQSEFLRDFKSLGLSLSSARLISKKYQVSFTAALVHEVLNSSWKCGVVFWEFRNKPVDKKNSSSQSQASYIGQGFKVNPGKKLRIRWAIGSPNTPFIPKNKSVPEESSIFQAWKSRTSNESEEIIFFSKTLSGKAKLENYSFTVEGEIKVISLFQFPKPSVLTEQFRLV